MSWHTPAYFLAIGAVANTDVPALSDDILTIQNNHFLLRSQVNLMAAYAGSLTAIRARMDSPTVRFYGNPMIHPINLGATPLNNPNWLYMPQRPYVLPAGEEIAIQGTANPGTTEPFTALLFLSQSVDPLPPGNIFTVRFTSTTAAVANKWTTITYTMDQGLPSGVYTMALSEIFSTNAIAHRWIFDNQTPRPGLLSKTLETNRSPTLTYLWPFGAMGRFYNTNLPRLQVLVNGTDASHTGYMSLIYMGAGPVTI